LLLKAAADAGLKVNWYTYYAGGTGGPTASSRPTSIIRFSRSAKVFRTSITRRRRSSKSDPRQVRLQPVLSARRQRDAHAGAAADKAKSVDPVKVALALEGMEFEVFDGGKGNMRKDDHQFFQPIYISSLGERTEKEPFDEEKTGWGWKLVAKIDTPATVLSDHLQDGTSELVVRA